MPGISICGLTAEEIFILVTLWGYKMSHAVSISNSVYKKRINDFSHITNIPKKLKEELKSVSYPGLFPPLSYEESSDGSVKYLFRNMEGLVYETVFLPDAKRNTVCVSTQSGCRMGCPFCVTGKYGFKGDLSVRDIVNQVLSLPVSDKVTNVVFMGMGEPMDNLGNVLKACNIITSEWGLALSPGNVTVSTVGITPGVREFLKGSECNLTVSLHSPFAEERMKIIPAEKKYPVNEIIGIMKDYPVKKKRRMSIAYVMIKNVNDTAEHLERLKDLLAGSKIRVNLLPYHPLPDDIFKQSSPDTMNYFKHELVMSGISASIRRSRGVDIYAACGLLASGLLQQQRQN